MTFLPLKSEAGVCLGTRTLIGISLNDMMEVGLNIDFLGGYLVDDGQIIPYQNCYHSVQRLEYIHWCLDREQ